MLTTEKPQVISLEEFLADPLERMEWVDGQLIEKQDTTAKHGRIQARLTRHWGNFMAASNLGGEVYTETLCRTVDRARCPDVAYLTPELVVQFGEFKTLPQSFVLIAEIVSPTDLAEEVFAKVKEYLQSGCEEVWLVFPENQWILVMTAQRQILFTLEETARTQVVLPGFSVSVQELLA